METLTTTRMHNDRRRFLATIRSEHADCYEISDKLAGLGQEFVEGLRIQSSDGLSIVKSCLLLRLISGFEVVCMLASNGFYTEAVGQKRSVMEALARLAALSKEPSLFDEYLMQDSLNRLKIS